MNNCIKCGKEIPDGELFCRQCSLEDVVDIDTEKAPAASAAPARKKTVKQDTIRLDPIKTKKPVGLIVSLVVVILLLAASVFYIFQNNSIVQRAKNQLRSAEVSAEKAQTESDSLQTRLTDANNEIAVLETEVSQLNSRIEELESQLHGQNSQSTQDAYNASAKDQEIQRLTTQADELAEQLNEANNQLETTAKDLEAATTALEEITETHAQQIEQYEETITEQIEELDKLNDKVDQLESENTSYLKKVTFMDRFVVFVENDGSNLYHTYDCSRFKKEDFWVFNPSYAKNQGYSECSNCH